VTTQPETAASPLHAQDDVARSVAIIMDGNGRWAESRGLPVAEGHRAGTKALRRTVEAAIDLGIESLTVYAFSTENWTRPPDEVDALMEIFHETIDRELPDLCKQGVRTRFIGRRDRAPTSCGAAWRSWKPRPRRTAARALDRVRLRRARRDRRRCSATRRGRRRGLRRSTRRRSDAGSTRPSFLIRIC
jgi:undecaprenyl pyrophosphate synthase